jgi:glycerol-3-phosphate dehydrogenase
VLPRLYDEEHAYILQNDDRRVIFVIPYEQEFSLIGTTDIPFDGDPAKVAISEAEAEYLCRAVSRYFRRPIAPGDAVHSYYSGVRPLYDDAAASASAVTRDYVLDQDAREGQAPILSVFGGKITTYRRLAEHAMDRLLADVPTPRPAPWTGQAALPGGDLPGGDCERFLASFQAAHTWLPAATARRLIRAYGTRAERLLGGAGGLADLGTDFGAGLTEAELDYLVREEWVRSADDALWRRSKLGLHLPAEARAAVADFLDRRVPEAADA